MNGLSIAMRPRRARYMMMTDIETKSVTACSGVLSLFRVVALVLGFLTSLVCLPSSVSQAQAENPDEMLRSASKRGDSSRIREALRLGAMVNAQNEAGETALMIACMKNEEAAAATLLDNHADVTVKAKDGNTALHYAASAGHLGLVRRLLEEGADPKAKNEKGWSARKCAYAANQVKVIEEFKTWLAMTSPANDKSAVLEKKALLIEACVAGNASHVRQLLKAGVKASETTEDGYTLTCLAANKGHLEAVEALLEKGANPNAPSGKEEYTPLMLAAAEGHKDVVRLLLEKGADHSARNTNGWTALWIAAAQGKKYVAELLIKAGADVNAPDETGLSPLSVAEAQGHSEIAKILKKKGAKKARTMAQPNHTTEVDTSQAVGSEPSYEEQSDEEPVRERPSGWR